MLPFAAQGPGKEPVRHQLLQHLCGNNDPEVAQQVAAALIWC
jgi:hypothetical protein